MNSIQMSLILEAVRKLSLTTETDAEDIIDSLTGIAWDEEDAGEIKRELEKE